MAGQPQANACQSSKMLEAEVLHPQELFILLDGSEVLSETSPTEAVDALRSRVREKASKFFEILSLVKLLF